MHRPLLGWARRLASLLDPAMPLWTDGGVRQQRRLQLRWQPARRWRRVPRHLPTSCRAGPCRPWHMPWARRQSRLGAHRKGPLRCWLPGSAPPLQQPPTSSRGQRCGCARHPDSLHPDAPILCSLLASTFSLLRSALPHRVLPVRVKIYSTRALNHTGVGSLAVNVRRLASHRATMRPTGLLGGVAMTSRCSRWRGLSRHRCRGGGVCSPARRVACRVGRGRGLGQRRGARQVGSKLQPRRQGCLVSAVTPWAP